MAGSPDFVIKLKSDATPYIAGAKSAIGANEQILASTKKLADEQIAAAAKAGQALIAQAQKTAAAQLAAAQKGAENEEKTVRALGEKIISQARRTADARMKEALKAASSEEAAARKASERIIAEAEKTAAASTAAAGRKVASQLAALQKLEQSEREVIDRQKAKARSVMTDEEVALAARVKITQRANQTRIKASVDAAEAEAKGFSVSRAAADLFGGSLTSVAGQFGLFLSFSSVLQELGDEFKRMNAGLYDSAKLVTDYREALLELAALKGQLGLTGETLAQDIAFRAQTLQSESESRSFQESALGAGESFISRGGMQKRISEDEFRKAMILGGSFQAVEHGSAATHGQLVGMMPLLMQQQGEVTGEQVFQKEQQLYNIFKPGGASFTKMTDQLMRVSPLVTSGVYKDVAEQASLLSMFSLTNKESPGEMVEQFTRATAGGIGRMKGVKVEGDSQKVGEYLSSLGVDNQMDPIAIGKKISADLSKQEAAEAAKGRRFNALDYLQHQGYGNQQDIAALMAFHGGRQEFERTFEPLAHTMPDVEASKAPIAAFQGSDPVAMRRRTQIAGVAANASQAGGAMEYWASLQEAAFQKLKGEGKAYGTQESFTSGMFYGPAHQNQIIQEAQRMQIEEAKRVGVEIPEGMQMGPVRNGMAIDTQATARQAYDLSLKIREKGGEALPGLDRMVSLAEQNLKALERIERTLQENGRGKPPGAPAGQTAGRQVVPQLGRPAVAVRPGGG